MLEVDVFIFFNIIYNVDSGGISALATKLFTFRAEVFLF